MSECNFHVGQRVVFVPVPAATEHQRQTRKRWRSSGLIIPDEGVVYTIRALGLGMDQVDGEIPVLFLEEIHNPKVRLFGCTELGEPGLSTRNFRPVVERKTDISVFQAMLNPSRTEVPA